MRQWKLKICLVFFMFSTLFLGIAFNTPPASAHSTAKPLNAALRPSDPCGHRLVHLHGKDAPTITCFDNSKQEVQPNIGLGNCDSAEVTIWWDTSFTGDYLCFVGNGFANLTDYAPAWYNVPLCHCTSWNDQASGFSLHGCALTGLPQSGNPDYPGYFAKDSNGNGQKQYFKDNISKSAKDFTGINGVLANDSLSSIYIDC
ncbi:hypothetical protein [Ktedonospora formicarum]|uniref:Cyanovirin-N domain-containing protein n=1 Tax=Ktedonospora formicarum TaxID=2778364 RepID=A0A8J3I8K1_9CHLR|nr:hypothetical protein [Ktedonospora formicarum]GHO49193.1 hypothetical protein KSX_73560 [Ktedonospora formicarum]